MRMSRLHARAKLRTIGIMSGTSLDGVDFVLTDVTRSPEMSVKYRDRAELAFPKELSRRLMSAARHELRVADLAELHFDLGRFYASGLARVLKARRWKADLVGLHGQTVYHRGGHATLQIGEASFLAERSNLPVVSDFRPMDIAFGGEGAPLAPHFHRIAFAKGEASLAVHNLGGISNLTLFRKGRMITAFDTGPANMPLDLCIQRATRGRSRFDRGGRLASKGTVHARLLTRLLAHPYLRKKAPKSCGREEFGERWLTPLLEKSRSLRLEDQLATLAEFIALSIAGSYLSLDGGVPGAIVFCGGGSRNTHLLERIRFHLPEAKVMTSEDLGWPSQAIEGAAFALLAASRVWEIPVDLTRATGASKAALLGKITDP